MIPLYEMSSCEIPLYEVTLPQKLEHEPSPDPRNSIRLLKGGLPHSTLPRTFSERTGVVRVIE